MYAIELTQKLFSLVFVLACFLILVFSVYMGENLDHCVILLFCLPCFCFFFIFISINSGKLCKDLRTKWQLREVRTEGGVRREYSFLQML